MHKLEQLKDELIEELESYAGEEKSVEHAMHIKCLASAVDHLCNICKDAEEEEMNSHRSMRMRSYRSERSYDDGSSYDDGMSGRRDNRGRFAVERGRSYSDGTEEEVERLMQSAKDEHTRRALQTALQTIRG